MKKVFVISIVLTVSSFTYVAAQQENERELFRTRLEDFNPNHELALLAKRIDWRYFEDEFKSYYSDKETPVEERADCAARIT